MSVLSVLINLMILYMMLKACSEKVNVFLITLSLHFSDNCQFSEHVKIFYLSL